MSGTKHAAVGLCVTVGLASLALTQVAGATALTVEPPEAKIESPAEGATYNPGQYVETTFSCKEGEGGPGLTSCRDESGIGLLFCIPGLCFSYGPIPGYFTTGTPGEHTYTVAAKSIDGQETTATLKYRVAGPPKVVIESPKGGGSYKQGAVVPTRFSCSEGEFGPGLETCGGVKGEKGTGTLNTKELGEHEYKVTASSKDGQEETAGIKYTVVPACSTIVGSGQLTVHGISGTLRISDHLTTALQGAQLVMTGPLVLALSKLESASCTKTATEAVFTADGQASAQGQAGYELALSFRNFLGSSYLSLTVSRNGRTVYTVPSTKIEPNARFEKPSLREHIY